MDKVERERLAALPQAEKNISIQNDIDVIHNSVNSGTTDRDAVNAALERIHACLSEPRTTKPAPDATYRAPGVTDAPSIQAPQSPAQP